MKVMNAFSEGKPVGDGIGPLVTGMLLNDLKENELDYIEDDLIVGELKHKQ